MLPPTSPARIAANRLNATRSSGPKTEAGKARSRANALKHGLTAKVVAIEGIEPSTPPVYLASGRLAGSWVEGEVRRLAALIDRSRRIDRKLRDEAKFRAETYWSEDRQVDAAALGAKLGDRPEWVVATLRCCPYGCSWLIGRWECLRMAATDPDGWDGPQTKLAFDLLGVPPEGRNRPVAEAIAYRQPPPGPPLSQLEIAEAMIAELREQEELVEEADEVAQRLAQHDMVDQPTPELARNRKYEAALQKRFFWLVEYLGANRPASTSAAEASVPVSEAPAPAGPAAPASPANQDSTTNPTPAAIQPSAAVQISMVPPANDPGPLGIDPAHGPTATEEHPRR